MSKSENSFMQNDAPSSPDENSLFSPEELRGMEQEVLKETDALSSEDTKPRHYAEDGEREVRASFQIDYGRPPKEGEIEKYIQYGSLENAPSDQDTDTNPESSPLQKDDFVDDALISEITTAINLENGGADSADEDPVRLNVHSVRPDSESAPTNNTETSGDSVKKEITETDQADTPTQEASYIPEQITDYINKVKEAHLLSVDAFKESTVENGRISGEEAILIHSKWFAAANEALKAAGSNEAARELILKNSPPPLQKKEGYSTNIAEETQSPDTPPKDTEIGEEKTPKDIPSSAEGTPQNSDEDNTTDVLSQETKTTDEYSHIKEDISKFEHDDESGLETEQDAIAAENHLRAIEDSKRETSSTEDVPTEHTEEKEINPETVSERVLGEFEKRVNITEEQLNNWEGFEKFSHLSEGQQLMTLENLAQLGLSRVEANAIDQHGEEFKAKMQESTSKVGQMWVAFKEAIGKGKDIKEREKIGAEELLGGGLDIHKETLTQLVEGMDSNGPEVLVNKNSGLLEVQFAGNFENLSESEKDTVSGFNKAANALSTIPAEWKYESATAKQRAQFKKASDEYNNLKAGLFDVYIDNSDQPVEAQLKMAEMESNVEIQQYLQTHPGAVAELEKIKDQSVWTAAAAGVFTRERGAYMALGAVGRTLLKGTLGLLAGPAVASAVGATRGYLRAGETMKQSDKDARRGKIDTSSEAKAMVNATGVIKEHDVYNEKTGEVLEVGETLRHITFASKLNVLIDRVNTQELLENRTASLDSPLKSGESEDKQKLLHSLKTRIDYTEQKLAEGSINLGEGADRIKNIYDIQTTLAEAKAAYAMRGETTDTEQVLEKDGTTPTSDHQPEQADMFSDSENETKKTFTPEERKDRVTERIHNIIDSNNKNLSETRRQFKINEMKKGAKLGFKWGLAGSVLAQAAGLAADFENEPISNQVNEEVTPSQPDPQQEAPFNPETYTEELMETDIDSILDHYLDDVRIDSAEIAQIDSVLEKMQESGLVSNREEAIEEILYKIPAKESYFHNALYDHLRTELFELRPRAEYIADTLELGEQISATQGELSSLKEIHPSHLEADDYGISDTLVFDDSAVQAKYNTLTSELSKLNAEQKILLNITFEHDEVVTSSLSVDGSKYEYHKDSESGFSIQNSVHITDTERALLEQQVGPRTMFNNKETVRWLNEELPKIRYEDSLINQSASEDRDLFDSILLDEQATEESTAQTTSGDSSIFDKITEETSSEAFTQEQLEQIRTESTQSLNHDINALYGTPAINNSAEVLGVNSPDWQDLKSRSIAEIIDAQNTTPQNSDVSDGGVGINSAEIVSQTNQYINTLVEKTGIRPTGRDTLADYLEYVHKEVSSENVLSGSSATLETQTEPDIENSSSDTVETAKKIDVQSRPTAEEINSEYTIGSERDLRDNLNDIIKESPLTQEQTQPTNPELNTTNKESLVEAEKAWNEVDDLHDTEDMKRAEALAQAAEKNSELSEETSEPVLSTSQTEQITIPEERAPLTPHTIERGDNLWKVLEEKIPEIKNASEGKQSNMVANIIASIKDNPESYGISSGDVSKLRVGDTLDLEKIHTILNDSKISVGGEEYTILERAHVLSPEEEANIESNNAKIGEYLRSHPGETLTEEGVDKIIAGEEPVVMEESVAQTDTVEQPIEATPEQLIQAGEIATASLNEDLDALYGHSGIGGLLETKGADSIDWKDLKNHTVSEVMNKNDFSKDLIDQTLDESSAPVGFDSPESVEQTQKYIQVLIDETGIDPLQGETVGDYYTRVHQETSLASVLSKTDISTEVEASLSESVSSEIPISEHTQKTAPVEIHTQSPSEEPGTNTIEEVEIQEKPTTPEPLSINKEQHILAIAEQKEFLKNVVSKTPNEWYAEGIANRRMVDDAVSRTARILTGSATPNMNDLQTARLFLFDNASDTALHSQAFEYTQFLHDHAEDQGFIGAAVSVN